MVSAVHGVMITADVPIKQYILHLNDVAPAERKFVVVDLDARRVLVDERGQDHWRRGFGAAWRSNFVTYESPSCELSLFLNRHCSRR